MKIKGHEGGLSRANVRIDRGEGRPPLELLLTALPLGATQEFDKAVPGPIPKTIGPLMRNGQVVRNTDGTVVMLTDKDSPKFKAAEELANRRQSTLMVHRALVNDPNVKFDADNANIRDTELADAIFQELSDFGLSIGDFGRLVTETLAVSHLSSEKLDRVRETFLPVAGE